MHFAKNLGKTSRDRLFLKGGERAYKSQTCRHIHALSLSSFQKQRDPIIKKLDLNFKQNAKRIRKNPHHEKNVLNKKFHMAKKHVKFLRLFCFL